MASTGAELVDVAAMFSANSEVSKKLVKAPSARVAVALIEAPTGTFAERIGEKLALPATSVVTFTKPR